MHGVDLAHRETVEAEREPYEQDMWRIREDRRYLRPRKHFYFFAILVGITAPVLHQCLNVCLTLSQRQELGVVRSDREDEV